MKRDSTFRRKDNGLSFIEIVMVTAILSLVSLAVYSILNNGVKIWQRVNKPVPEEDLNIFLGRFTQDLKNALKFTGIDFIGTEYYFEVPSLVRSDSLKCDTVGKVIYYYDKGDKILKRQRQDLPQIYSRQDAFLTHQLGGVESLRFQYYSFDEKKNAFLWQDEWEVKDELPLSVKVELQFNNGTQTKEFAQSADIPVSG